MPALLTVHDLHFAHDGRAILHGVGLELAAGEVLVVVGPSGCGKTTLLRLIAGLERPAAGRITVQGRVLSGGVAWVPPEERPVGFVFQGLALFPHLTVRGNVGFGLADRPRAERERRVQEELAAVGLEGLGDRYPHQLSGGQQQRVAIARSLVRRPALMLMDEPFSDLDPGTRAAVRQEVLRILRDHGTGAVVVTHDREDAFHLADRIAEMDQGRIVRIGAAAELRAAWSAHPFAP
ncbi:MAG: ABC transporter ATP-binding protein [Flavobacteriales bacterium]|nr:ABC transporter ATP-binding protein [Flavobacteriales bacterium]